MADNYVRLDESAVKKLTSYLEGMPKQAPVAIARAINRAIDSTKTEASRILKENYTIKASSVKQSLSVKKASKNELVAQFLSSANSASLSMAHYKFSPNKETTGKAFKPVTVEIKKGSPFEVKNGFVWNGTVFRRTGKNRLPIEVKTGPTVPQLLSQEDAFEALQAKAEETFMKRLDHEVGVLLKGVTK